MCPSERLQRESNMCMHHKGAGAAAKGLLAHPNCVAVFNLMEDRETENNLLPAGKYLNAPQTSFGPLAFFFPAKQQNNKTNRKIVIYETEMLVHTRDSVYFKFIERVQNVQ